MYILGVYVSIVDLLIIFSGFVVLVLLYLAYEINRLKKIEKMFETVEKMLEREEKDLEMNIKKISRKKKTKKRTKRKR